MVISIDGPANSKCMKQMFDVKTNDLKLQTCGGINICLGKSTHGQKNVQRMNDKTMAIDASRNCMYDKLKDVVWL